MKTFSISRAAARVAVVGATAVALTLGTTGLAGATDSTTGSASFASGSDAARKAPYLTSFSAAADPIGGAATRVGTGAQGSTPAGTNRITANVRKGSTVLGPVEFTPGAPFFNYPAAWGRGNRVLTDVTFYNGATRLDGDNAQAGFAVRSAVKGRVKIRSTGSSKRVRAVGKIYSTSKGKYVTAKRVRFQVLSGGKWRTKKTIKLNKKGVGTYSFRASGKKKYRIAITQTSTVQGAKTRGIRI